MGNLAVNFAVHEVLYPQGATRSDPWEIHLDAVMAIEWPAAMNFPNYGLFVSPRFDEGYRRLYKDDNTEVVIPVRNNSFIVLNEFLGAAAFGRYARFGPIDSEEPPFTEDANRTIYVLTKQV